MQGASAAAVLKRQRSMHTNKAMRHVGQDVGVVEHTPTIVHDDYSINATAFAARQTARALLIIFHPPGGRYRRRIIASRLRTHL